MAAEQEQSLHAEVVGAASQDADHPARQSCAKLDKQWTKCLKRRGGARGKCADAEKQFVSCVATDGDVCGEERDVRRILQCFNAKLWWLEMVNFIEVLEDIGCFGFWDVGMCVHVNLERIWH